MSPPTLSSSVPSIILPSLSKTPKRSLDQRRKKAIPQQVKPQSHKISTSGSFSSCLSIFSPVPLKLFPSSLFWLLSFPSFQCQSKLFTESQWLWLFVLSFHELSPSRIMVPSRICTREPCVKMSLSIISFLFFIVFFFLSSSFIFFFVLSSLSSRSPSLPISPALPLFYVMFFSVIFLSDSVNIHA
jgi:hypothetical protein